MKTLLASLLLATFCVFIGAQPIDSASVDQFVEKLQAPEVKTRSFRNLVPAPRTLDLVIRFEFDSSKIQESSKPLLNTLAAAMKTEKLLNLNFSVEGHTDAKGSADYNLRLSERRAEAVVNYMAQQGIAKDRLTALGKGASELLKPESPEAFENRRVKISTLN